MSEKKDTPPPRKSSFSSLWGFVKDKATWPFKKRRTGAEEKRTGAEGAEANVPAASLFGLPLILQGEIGSWTRMSDLFFLRFISQKHGEAMFEAALKHLERVVLDVRDHEFWNKDRQRAETFLRDQVLEKATGFCRTVQISGISRLHPATLRKIGQLSRLETIEMSQFVPTHDIGTTNGLATYVWDCINLLLPTKSVRLKTFILQQPVSDAFLGHEDLLGNEVASNGKIALIGQFVTSPVEVLILPKFLWISSSIINLLVTTTPYFRGLRQLEIVCPWTEVLPAMCKAWQGQNMQHLDLRCTSENFEELKNVQLCLSTLVTACPKLLHCRLALVEPGVLSSVIFGWNRPKLSSPLTGQLITTSDAKQELEWLDAIQPSRKWDGLSLNADEKMAIKLNLLAQSIQHVRQIDFLTERSTNARILKLDLSKVTGSLKNDLKRLYQECKLERLTLNSADSDWSIKQMRLQMDFSTGSISFTFLGNENKHFKPWLGAFQEATANGWKVCDHIVPTDLYRSQNFSYRFPSKLGHLWDMLRMIVDIGQQTLNVVKFRFAKSARILASGYKPTSPNSWLWIQQDSGAQEAGTPTLEALLISDDFAPGLLALPHLTELDLSRFVLKFDSLLSPLAEHKSLSKLTLILTAATDLCPLDLLPSDQYTHVSLKILCTSRKIEHLVSLLNRSKLATFFASHSKLEQFTYRVHPNYVFDEKQWQQQKELVLPFPRLAKPHLNMRKLDMTVLEKRLEWKELTGIWNDFPHLEQLRMRMCFPTGIWEVFPHLELRMCMYFPVTENTLETRIEDINIEKEKKHWQQLIAQTKPKSLQKIIIRDQWKEITQFPIGKKWDPDVLWLTGGWPIGHPPDPEQALRPAMDTSSGTAGTGQYISNQLEATAWLSLLESL